jgi:hypothetical protein
MLVTLDWYSIAVRHRIGISQQFNVTAADIANLPALAYVGAGGTVQYFTNGFDTKTKGTDLVVSYPSNSATLATWKRPLHLTTISLTSRNMTRTSSLWRESMT